MWLDWNEAPKDGTPVCGMLARTGDMQDSPEGLRNPQPVRALDPETKAPLLDIIGFVEAPEQVLVRWDGTQWIDVEPLAEVQARIDGRTPVLFWREPEARVQ